MMRAVELLIYYTLIGRKLVLVCNLLLATFQTSKAPQNVARLFRLDFATPQISNNFVSSLPELAREGLSNGPADSVFTRADAHSQFSLNLMPDESDDRLIVLLAGSLR